MLASQITLSEELSEFYRLEVTSLVNWWRRHFNYSSNDPRYLSATIDQVREDYLIFRMGLLEDSGLFKISKSLDEAVEEEEISQDQFEKEKQKAIKDLMSIKYNEENYADEEFIDEYFRERDYFQQQYENFKDMVSDEDIQRMRKMGEAWHIDKEVRAIYEKHDKGKNLYPKEDGGK